MNLHMGHCPWSLVRQHASSAERAGPPRPEIDDTGALVLVDHAFGRRLVTSRPGRCGSVSFSGMSIRDGGRERGSGKFTSKHGHVQGSLSE